MSFDNPSRGQAKTVTAATYTVDTSGNIDFVIIANFAGTVTLTLPSASIFKGRVMRCITYTANTVVSASSNVAAIATGTAGTAILAGTAGKWADLESDGTNWLITAAN